MYGYRWLSTLTAVFVTSLIVSNIIAVKVCSLGPVVLPAAMIIFPISYIFGDVLTEVYGYAKTRRVIWTGFFCNLIAVVAIWVSIQLPPDPFWKAGGLESMEASQRAYEAIMGFTPRLLAASFIAYLFGEFLNAYVLAKMKIATQGKYLWTRTIGSTLVGQLADSGIFIVLAFYGTLPLWIIVRMIFFQWIFKSLYEAVVTPFTYLVVNFLKNAEGEDYFDRKTNFNPFVLRD